MTILVSDGGTIRFKCNRIVRDLLQSSRDGARLDLNTIAMRAQCNEYTLDEWQEIYQLLGYSVDGYQEIFDAERLEGKR